MNVAPLRTSLAPTPRYDSAGILARFGSDLEQLGATQLLPMTDGVDVDFSNPRDAYLGQEVLRDTVGGAKLLVSQYRCLQQPLTMSEVTSMLGRLDAVRSVQHLPTANMLSIMTQDVESRDRLRELLADTMLGADVTVDMEQRFHPSI